MLVSSQMILFPVLLGDPMSVRGDVMQFGGSLVVFVVRSVVIASGHNLKTHDLPQLGVGFLCQFVRLIRKLQGSFGMPASALRLFLSMKGTNAFEPS